MSVVKASIAQMIENDELKDEVLHGHSVTMKDSSFITFYDYEGTLKEEDIAHINYKPTHIVIANFADVKVEDNTKSRVLITLVKGSFIQVIKDNQVLLADGGIGYINPRFIREFIRDKNLIIPNALSYLEVPYRWGGKTPMGIDCSGFVFMSYLLAGFIIHRDAHLVSPIIEISPSEMRPNDLIFFEGHVAIYIGNGNIIHAGSKNGMVKIESLSKRNDIVKVGAYV
ncbi:MAG: C40 family peptidase [Defluviitaleaceae bacterium]|nr:C40 family peptidase [Defluviitaleaceae bacterium]